LQAVEHYTELLTYVKSAVTRNYSEKSINNMLDFIEKNAADEAANQCMEQFYSKTLESFQATNNERLWLSTNTKLARLWLAQKDYDRFLTSFEPYFPSFQRALARFSKF
jgi:COP9 signalosome complex subunit 2